MKKLLNIVIQIDEEEAPKISADREKEEAKSEERCIVRYLTDRDEKATLFLPVRKLSKEAKVDYDKLITFLKTKCTQ